MSQLFKLEVLTPERMFFSDTIESLIITTQTGQMGILANSTPMATAIVPGFIRVKKDGVWREASIADGFMEVKPDEVVVLCQLAMWPDEIIEEDIIMETNKETEILRQAQSLKEYELSKAAIARAFAQLRVKKHRETHIEF